MSALLCLTMIETLELGKGDVAVYKGIDDKMLHHVINVQNYFDMKEGIDAALQYLADQINECRKTDNIERCRTLLGEEGDFTPDEEAEAKETSVWRVAT